MAFFTDNFLNDRRGELLRSLNRFQYRINGTWHDGTINKKEISGTDVVVYVNAPSTGAVDTITGVRIYDLNEKLAGQQDISLSRPQKNSSLLLFTFPLIEATT